MLGAISASSTSTRPMKSTMMITTIINDRTRCEHSLVDSGASSSLLSYDCFNSMPNRPHMTYLKESPVVRGIVGHPFDIIGFVDVPLTVIVGTESRRHMVRLFVADNIALPLIIGIDNIGTFIESISFATHEMKLHPKSFVPPDKHLTPPLGSMYNVAEPMSSSSSSSSPAIDNDNIDPASSHFSRVVVAHGAVLPKRSSTLVELALYDSLLADVKETVNIICEPIDLFDAKGQLIPIQWLNFVISNRPDKHVNRSPNLIRYLHTFIFNPTDQPINMIAGTIIGIASRCVIINDSRPFESAVAKVPVSKEPVPPDIASDIEAAILSPSVSAYDMTRRLDDLVLYLEFDDGLHPLPLISKAEEKPKIPFEDQVRVNPELSDDQKGLIRSVVQEFPAAFALNPSAPPTVPDVRHYIDTGKSPPVKSPAYRYSPSKNALIDDMTAQYYKFGQIEKATSPWNSPPLLVGKADGSARMCIDFRRLNNVTVKDAYLMPRIDDILWSLKDAVHFSAFDLASGFHHILINEDDKVKTAFTTSSGQFQWRVMPFGLSNAPATFQRLMDEIFSPMKHLGVHVYFDDVCVATSGTFEHHMSIVRLVLQECITRHLSIKASKAKIGFTHMVFLGHEISHGTIRADPSRCDAIKKMQPPKNIPELRSFLGCANYYRQYIKDFALIADPLYQLLRKHTAFDMNDERLASFTSLRDALISPAVLHCPDHSRRFILYTDASSIGIGGVLTQVFDDGEHPVEFISRKLLPSETRYFTTEQECLAIVWCIRKFDIFLNNGNEFDIITDHNPLAFLKTAKATVNKRCLRWAIFLSSYRYTIKYRPGKKNGNADAVSRLPIDSTDPADGAGVEAELALSIIDASLLDAVDLCYINAIADMNRTPIFVAPILFDPDGRSINRNSDRSPDVMLSQYPTYNRRLALLPLIDIDNQHLAVINVGAKIRRDTFITEVAGELYTENDAIALAAERLIPLLADTDEPMSNVDKPLETTLHRASIEVTRPFWKFKFKKHSFAIDTSYPSLTGDYQSHLPVVHDILLGHAAFHNINGEGYGIARYLEYNREPNVAVFICNRTHENIHTRTFNGDEPNKSTSFGFDASKHYPRVLLFALRDIRNDEKLSVDIAYRTSFAPSSFNDTSPAASAAPVASSSPAPSSSMNDNVDFDMFDNNTPSPDPPPVAVSASPEPSAEVPVLPRLDIDNAIPPATPEPSASASDPSPDPTADRDDDSSHSAVQSYPLFDPEKIKIISEAQRTDPVLRPFIDYVESNGKIQPADANTRAEYARTYRKFVIHGKYRTLFHRTDPKIHRSFASTSGFLSLVIPSTYRNDVLHTVHDNGGHFGVEKTYARLHGRYYWTGMFDDTANYVRHCVNCQSKKVPRTKSKLLKMSMSDPSFPMDRVSVDTLGPFKGDSKGFKFCIIFVDYFTKFAICIPVREQSAETTARIFLEQIVFKFGPPTYLLSDRGSNYMSQVMKEVKALTKTRSLATTAYHPQTNGLVERFNHTIVQILSLIADMKKEDWSDYIHAACYAYNTSQQSSTMESPFYLMFGRDPTPLGENMIQYRESGFEGESEFINTMQDRFSWSYQFVKSQFESKRLKLSTANASMPKHMSFSIGDLVWLLHPLKVSARSIASKFLHPYLGPYIVISKTSPINYEIKLKDDSKEPPVIVNAARLKPYYEPLDISSSTIHNVPTKSDLRPFRADRHDPPVLVDRSASSLPADHVDEGAPSAATSSTNRLQQNERGDGSHRTRSKAKGSKVRRSYAGQAPSRQELNAEMRRDVYGDDSYIQ